MNASERKAIEALAPRATFGFQVAQSGKDDAGQYRVSGIMNSFGVMQSGRILHPAPFEAWLKGPGKTATLPMLAQHGMVAGFASIGVWDRFERVAGGMRWSGFLAQGTQLADDARTLLDQKVLNQLSLGWMALQARWVRNSDTDLDPVIKEAMELAGVDEAYAILDWYPVEGSIVDVADDSAGRLAAGADAPAIAAALAPIRAEIAALRNELRALAGTASANSVSADLGPLLEDFLRDFQTAALDALAADPAVQGEAAALRADIDAGVFGASAGGATERLRSRIDAFGKGDGR